MPGNIFEGAIILAGAGIVAVIIFLFSPKGDR